MIELEQQLVNLQRELGKLEKQLLEINVRLQKVEFELNLKKIEGIFEFTATDKGAKNTPVKLIVR